MDATRLRQEVRQAIAHLEEALGARSRWSGRVLIAGPNGEGTAWVNWNYDLVFRPIVLQMRPGPLISLIYHEAAHTFSPARTLRSPVDRLWEEVLAELVARRFRFRRLRALPRHWSREALRRYDREDAYSPMVATFRRICRARGIDAEALACRLIQLNEPRRRAAAFALLPHRPLRAWEARWAKAFDGPEDRWAPLLARDPGQP